MGWISCCRGVRAVIVLSRLDSQCRWRAAYTRGAPACWLSIDRRRMILAAICHMQARVADRAAGSRDRTFRSIYVVCPPILGEFTRGAASAP